jgi:hypothetical protein
MNIEIFYDVARVSGLLTELRAGGTTAYCAFRSPDDTVLEGLAISRDHQIDYPASWLSLSAGETVEIGGASYRVREVRSIGDGTERRASLSPLS